MTRTIFTNANLLDGENAARPGTTIVIDGDQIQSVGADAPQSPADVVVDLGGMTLMPGMVSGHYHAAYSGSGEQVLSTDTPQTQQALWALGNVQTALRTGYTSVVGAGTYFDIDARLAEALDAGVVTGARLIPSSRALAPSVVGGGRAEDSPFPTYVGPEAYRAATLAEIENGARIIKIFAASGHALLGTRDMTEEEITAAVDAAHENGARVRAHVAGRDAVLRCARLGVDIIDHADGTDDTCIEAFLEHDCFVLPSLYMGYLSANDPTVPGAELYAAEDFEYMRGMLPKMAEAGVKLVPGDDYGFGALVHGDYSRELACYVDAVGIDPIEVIKWATKNGGQLTGVPNLGTIAPGMIADFVVVDGDPSKDINLLCEPDRLVAVIKAGETVHGSLPVLPYQAAAMAS
jgi:imidazolonepropionase-like amidohydrolase